MIKYLLDTNICIYVIKRRPIEALARFNEAAGHLAISSVTLAELLHGVEKSQQVAKNLLAVEDFYSRLDVLEYGEQAAFHYGDIRAQLEKQGRPIGVNDLHIAAHARSIGATLVTNNMKEFERVDGLRLQNWVAGS
ncbi:type II toxin-antitoxin system tRNA(fMet)-specific endonuclease VapC [Marinospirillum alkaliphilum]|uniref:Ribonuclease VapC n=1 Tax=Marinospirillum alkaliphilum DSM 21637 TaxID=1122209 RepID=A0A1K1U927_9GAMM|nr:type II toxin-antitoxin system VapC family toxin [Marinospirillum alkaliphilum]SFX09351.1 tRNA(fMet)-specific endonuclease VapC [Marinospirillum alkaliphilum DSM 21637]